MPRNIHPVTGCRLDQLFGEWAIDPVIHQQLVDVCVNIPLETLVAREPTSGDEASGDDSTKLYDVVGRTAVISLEGPLTKQPTSFASAIGGSSTVRARQGVRAAIDDPSVDRVLLKVESPGGTIGGTRDLYETIRKYDRVKPIYGFADDVCGSAAYWIICACREVSANANAIVGSIGAYTVLRDTSGAMKQRGVKLHVVSSGKYKGAGAPGTPVTDDALKVAQERIDSFAELFIDDVAAARKMKREEVVALADGRAFIAADAKQKGLIDRVESFDNTLVRLNNKSVANSDPTRRNRMLNSEQLAQARQLPGLASITEENADVALLQFATGAHSQLTSTRNELTSVKAKLPTEYPADLLKGYADLALAQADLLVSQGKMLPAQREQFKNLVMPGDQPSASALVAPTGQTPQYKQVLAVMELNKPNGLVEKKTGAQPAPQTEPGSAQANADSSKVPTYERWCELREQSKLSHMSLDQYKAHFGIA